MPHPPDEYLETGPVGHFFGRALFAFYALIIVGTPILFISYWIKYGA